MYFVWRPAAGAVVARHNPNARFYEVISSRGDVEAVHIHIPGVPFADHQEPSYCKMNGQEVFKFAVESPVRLSNKCYLTWMIQ